MSIKTAAGLAIALLVLGGAANHYHAQAVQWRKRYRDVNEVAGQQAATLAETQKRQQQLASLDNIHTEALNAAETDNDNLRRQLAAGTRRMYVHATCPVPGTGAKTTPGGLGDAAGVELAADARQHVLDIRAGLLRDREKLTYLQQYIQTECLHSPQESFHVDNPLADKP